MQLVKAQGRELSLPGALDCRTCVRGLPSFTCKAEPSSPFSGRYYTTALVALGTNVVSAVSLAKSAASQNSVSPPAETPNSSHGCGLPASYLRTWEAFQMGQPVLVFAPNMFLS